MSLAAKLPYNHPFAGGYPGLGSQPLPGDSDALTYLGAVAAADGAGVETSVAMAVDGFIRDCKAAGIWDAIKASCILCGARTLSGALVPLAGSAPTSVGFVSGDYSRTAGLKGDGTSVIGSNRDNSDDPQNDFHMACYAASLGTIANANAMGTGVVLGGSIISTTGTAFRIKSDSYAFVFSSGFIGSSRSSGTTASIRSAGATTTISLPSATPAAGGITVFGRGSTASPGGVTDGTIAFYSIGTAVDLESLDAAVTALITAIGTAI